MRARFVCIVLLLVALASPALAQDRRGGLDRILPQVSRNVPGTFYDAEGPFLAPDGRASYRIKWMTPEGRIVWLTVDAGSGQVMGGMPSAGANRYRNDDYSERRGNRDDGPDRPYNWRNDRDWDGDRGGSDRGARNRDRGDQDRDGWSRDRRDRDEWNRRGDGNRDGGRDSWRRGGGDRGGGDRGGRDWNRGGRGGDRSGDRGGHNRRKGD